MDNEIKVSIECLVYNHEPYLRDCLDGIVMQKTNFRFEAIVHDDCSTDHSADIIREYEAKYPDIIKPIYEKENQFSKGAGGLTKSKMNGISYGKYIAFCEGDDYWIDPYKLQKQFDYLETHPNTVMCFTNFNVLYQESGLLKKSVLTSDPTKYHTDFSLEQWIISPGYIGPMTWLIRRKAWFTIPEIPTSDGTYLWVSHFLSLGKIFCLKDLTSAVYRSHKGSITNSLSFKTQYWQKLNFYYAKCHLIDYYLKDDRKKDELKREVLNDFFNNNYCKKILCYGDKKDIDILHRHISNLSLINKILYHLCKIRIIRSLYRIIYLTYVHKRTSLSV